MLLLFFFAYKWLFLGALFDILFFGVTELFKFFHELSSIVSLLVKEKIVFDSHQNYLRAFDVSISYAGLQHWIVTDGRVNIFEFEFVC